LPNFYGDDGNPVVVTSNGCYESDFDQYGDMEAFGVHPDWQRQLSKFASVQDRLREWKPEVMARLQKFSCMAITALDLDGIRLDKSTQVTVDALSNWTSSARDCATKLGKKNFLITGEVTGGDTFGALYMLVAISLSSCDVSLTAVVRGRGRTPTQRPTDSSKIMGLTNSTVGVFMRDLNKNGIDGVAFHYSIYRVLTRMLGMDGNLQVAFDVPTNLVDAWGTIFVNDDMLNPNTGVTDPKHMFGTSNFDVFRWPSLQSGVLKGAVGSFITSLLMPGIFLMFYGEEQNFYLFDTTASNYLYG
jgi:alpha-1,3-glucan synthase